MRRQFFVWLCLLLFAGSTYVGGIAGCGGGGGGFDAVEVNTLDGRTSIPVGSSFQYKFTGSVDASSVTAASYFILPTPAPSAQVAKAAYDGTVCESASALPASIFCSPVLGCILEPGANLSADASYTICLAPTIRYATGGSFEGFMATFTTSSGTSYAVTYDGNGNTGGTAPTDSTSYETGQTVTVLDNTGALVKTGNAFAGWNTLADGSGTTYTVGQTFAMGSANVTLYAKWTTNPTYTVTYDGNGNTGGTAPTDSTNYETGQTVTVLDNTGALVKAGSTFAGWNTEAGGGGTTYTAGQTFAMGSANVTLYALWMDVLKIFVTAGTWNGQLGQGGAAITLAAIDALCMADANKPAGGGTYKAMFTTTTAGQRRIACTTEDCSAGIGENENWVMKPNTDYYRCDGTTLIGTTNAGGVFPLAFGQSLDNSISGVDEGYFTGLDGYGGPGAWTASFANCSNWTSGLGGIATEGLGTGTTGITSDDNGAIAAWAQPCDWTLHLVCVEQ